MANEDRIENFARWVLVGLLVATLGFVSVGNAQDKSLDGSAPVILVAKPGLSDAFYGSSILVVKPIGNGRHIGFAINRPTQMTLGKLFPEHAASQKVPDPVYLGGPVNTEVIFALVRSNVPPGGESLQFSRDLFIAVDAKTVDGIIEADASQARYFAGLVAWRPGELQDELRRGIWFVLESDSDLVMRKSTEGLWEELVTRSQQRANTI